MAFCDYHICDLCGENTTFCDAGVWSEEAESNGYPSGIWGDNDMADLCESCAKTHRVVIVPKDEKAGA